MWLREGCWDCRCCHLCVDGGGRLINQKRPHSSYMYVDSFKCVCVLSRCFSKSSIRRAFVSLHSRNPFKLQIGPRLSWAQSRHNRAVLRSVEEAERRQQCIPSPWRLDIRGMLLSKRNDSVTQQDQSVDTDCSLDHLLSLCYCVFPVNPCLLSWSCCFYVKMDLFWTKD